MKIEINSTQELLIIDMLHTATTTRHLKSIVKKYKTEINIINHLDTIVININYDSQFLYRFISRQLLITYPKKLFYFLNNFNAVITRVLIKNYSSKD